MHVLTRMAGQAPHSPAPSSEPHEPPPPFPRPSVKVGYPYVHACFVLCKLWFEVQAPRSAARTNHLRRSPTSPRRSPSSCRRSSSRSTRPRRRTRLRPPLAAPPSPMSWSSSGSSPGTAAQGCTATRGPATGGAEEVRVLRAVCCVIRLAVCDCADPAWRHRELLGRGVRGVCMCVRPAAPGRISSAPLRGAVHGKSCGSLVNAANR